MSALVGCSMLGCAESGADALPPYVAASPSELESQSESKRWGLDLVWCPALAL